MFVFNARNNYFGKTNCFQFIKLKCGRFAQIRMMFGAEGKQQIMALLKQTERDVEPNTDVCQKRFGG